MRISILTCLLFASSPAQAQDLVGSIVDLVVDGGNSYVWEKVELPGARCGDGSQYKFFVHRTSSRNLLYLFEGGGACWDYDTCSGRAGVLGAANPNGIADDYMQSAQMRYVSPIMNGADPGLPLRARTDLVTKGWNVVFMPYCTGDVHIGNRTITYADPSGVEPPLTWHHAGYANTIAAADWVHAQFPSVSKLLVTGYSAGGAAAISAYYFVRSRIAPARGYLLDDSGPIFFAPNQSSLSRDLHDFIRQSWDLDSIFGFYPASYDPSDFGSINRVIALEFPNDQIAYTGYTRDYNYSRFSYERFRTPNDEASIHGYWKEDQDAFVAQIGQYPNVSYFIPFHRPLNQSHCSTILTFIGSHACQRMEKKRTFWEYLSEPWGQTYKCYSELVPMATFLERFVAQDRQVRIYEPENWYNEQDPGMQIVAPLLNSALGL